MPGARSTFARFVDQGMTFIITNLDDVDIDALVSGVTGLYLPQNLRK